MSIKKTNDGKIASLSHIGTCSKNIKRSVIESKNKIKMTHIIALQNHTTAL